MTAVQSWTEQFIGASYMAKYGSRGYSMRMASMRAVYRNKPARRAYVKSLTRAKRRK